MAQINPIALAEAVQVVTPIASDPTPGDRIQVGAGGKNLHVVLINAHTSAITVTCTPTTTAANIDRFGNLTKAAIAVSVPANTGRAVLFIPAAALPAYIDASGFVNLSYTSGNAALTLIPLFT